MNEEKAENIIQLFKEQENRLSYIIELIPFNESTKKIVLPVLSSIIVECGSLLDTILREEFDDNNKSKKDCNIADFAKFYEDKYHFSKAKNLLLIYPPTYITPFSKWIDSMGEYKPLFWWQNYNELKHRRIENFELSNLETAINSLCALHQIIAQLPTFINSLLRNNMISYGDNNLNYVTVQLNSSQSETTVLIESKFFATPIGPQSFPDDIENIKPIDYSSSKKLAHFIGKF
jgi:hypothetical protein